MTRKRQKVEKRDEMRLLKRQWAADTCRNGAKDTPGEVQSGAEWVLHDHWRPPVSFLSVFSVSHVTPESNSECSLKTNTLTLHIKLHAHDTQILCKILSDH